VPFPICLPPLAVPGCRRDFIEACRSTQLCLLAESILLAVIGGVVGVLAAATALYANAKGWAVVIPVEAWLGGIASAILIGAVASLMPAVRASRMPPTVGIANGMRVDLCREAPLRPANAGALTAAQQSASDVAVSFGTAVWVPA
jgi:hypothetical protein